MVVLKRLSTLLMSVDDAAGEHSRSVVPVVCRWWRADTIPVKDLNSATHFTRRQTRFTRRTAGLSSRFL